MPDRRLLLALLAVVLAGAAGAGTVLAVQAAGSDGPSRPVTAASPDAGPSVSPTPSSSPSPARSASPSASPTSSPTRVAVPALDVAALRRAPVPSLCGHPAGRLVDGHLPGTPRGEGGVELSDTSFGDLDGDGVVEGAALVSCSQGNSVETSVHLYRSGLRPLGQVEHDQGLDDPFAATSVRITGRRLQVAGRSYDSDDARCCPSGLLVRRFRLRGSTVSLAPPPGLDDDAVLTGDGLGSVRVGDLYLELGRATGLRISLDSLEDGQPEDASCAYVGVGDSDAVSVMGGSGKVRAVVVSGRGVRSRSGIGVGDTEAEVLRAYGDRADRVPNEYVDVDDVVVAAGPGRILRFEFDEDHVVTTVHAGEVEFASLVEGCA